ncbi:MAG: hypothetical protein J6Z34_00380 [Clostridia bacterium]|nr:hypothetical protein [Clostridia bacterium]
MKKIAALSLAFFIVLFAEGCGIIGGAILKSCVDGDTSVITHRLISVRCNFTTADGYLNGLGLDEVFSLLDDPYATGYKYSDANDYEYFVFTQKSVREINITVVPYGKNFPYRETVRGEKTSEGGLDIEYAFETRRHEDYYEFRCRAKVECKGDVAFVNYNYSSVSPLCEIIELVTALFYAKG